MLRFRVRRRRRAVRNAMREVMRGWRDSGCVGDLQMCDGVVQAAIHARP
jgi:hypothetical protein